MPDITITLTEQEQAAFSLVCDAACRQGIQAAAPAVALLSKLQQASRGQSNGQFRKPAEVNQNVGT